MILKKLILENIRSYENEIVDFPFGTTLVAGDVGAGKSTILIAIEFALFGISKGDLSGDILLRKGKSAGSVELYFAVDKNEYIIKRTLKRSSNGITQESGFLTRDSTRSELTPTELKNRIYTILNYPLEQINKRPLIYKYTVYTPQEEMKLILLGGKDSRIETLRKVFNIDKYQKIKENSKIIISAVKEKKKQLMGSIEDLDEKIKKKEELSIRLNSLEIRLGPSISQLDKIMDELKLKKAEIKHYEDKKNELEAIQSQLKIIDYEIRSKGEGINKNKSEIELLQTKINELKKETETGIDIDLVKEKKKSFEDNLTVAGNDLKTISNALLELKIKKDNELKIKKSISELDVCPICKQGVLETYKAKINNETNEKITGYDFHINNFLEKDNKIKEIKNELEDHLKTLMEKERQFELLKFKRYDLEKKEEKLEELQTKISDSELIVKDLEIKRTVVLTDISSISIDENYEIIKEEFDQLTKKEKEVQIEKVKIEKEMEVIDENIENLSLDIKKKIETKNKINAYIELKDWLENDFINMLDIIEKKVMVKIHYDFNKMFVKWFQLLMGEEALTVSLDTEFSPKIEQNGYDVDYDNLSGGEKTACALAYRLALNQTINNLVSTINTKDIIILDEPTDGFSSDQLDNVKLVLKELNVKQIIIVSHEAKIESFCDNIIKIEKASHISRVFNRPSTVL